MNYRGLLAAVVFLGSIVATHSATATQSSFVWVHGLVIEGASTEVKVESAPCSPVTVTLFVNGQTVTRIIDTIPGTCTLPVPEDTSGEGYTISIKCPLEATSDSGQVI